MKKFLVILFSALVIVSCSDNKQTRLPEDSFYVFPQDSVQCTDDPSLEWCKAACDIDKKHKWC